MTMTGEQRKIYRKGLCIQIIGTIGRFPFLIQILLLLFCFETCTTDGSCPGQQGPNNITFNLDMNAYTASFNTVYINGDFNGWCGSCNPLSDSDGDGIWSVTLPFNQSSIEYLFTVDGWTNQETFSVGSPCTLTTGPYTNSGYLQ